MKSTFQKALILAPAVFKNRDYLAQTSYRDSGLWYNFSFKKFFNHRLNVQEQKARKVVLKSKPTRYLVDINNMCNLSCPLCFSGGLQKKYPQIRRGFMKPEQFKHILDQIKDYAIDLWLFNWGEPFLHPQLDEILYLTKQAKASVVLSSNLNIFDERKAELLVKNEVHRIIISIDGVDQESYQTYRAGGNFETLKNNIRLLVAKKKELKSAYPLLIAQCIVMKHNQDKLEQFKTLFEGLGVDIVDFVPMSLMSQDGDELSKSLKSDHPRYSPYYELARKEWCKDLYDTLVFNYNGDVYTCCMIALDAKLKYANIFEHSLDQIWNNDFYRYSRQLFSAEGETQGSQKQVMCNVCKGLQKSSELSELL